MFRRESRYPKFWAWLLICFCIGQGVLPDLVLCMETDGRLMVETAVDGKCSDLVRALPTGMALPTVVAAPRYCEICEDLPLVSSVAFRLPSPVPTQVPLLAIPAMVVHPVLQPLAQAAVRIDSFLLPLVPPSSTLLTLRSTILLI